MKDKTVLELTDVLVSIQTLTSVLAPLGWEEFGEFKRSFDRVVAQIFPTYSVAFAGPVNSGKSTVVSSLLREAGRGGAHPIASIGPTNETFAPMTIAYGSEPTLVVRYFGVEILNRLEEHLSDLERIGDRPDQVAQYREVRNQLRRVDAVLAGQNDTEVVRQIPLRSKNRDEIVSTLREYVAQTSGRADVVGIYKVELTYPGELLQEMRNVKFTDLFGFGEPSPLIKSKYTRFAAEEEQDAIVYVFPDRAVTEQFLELFELPGFLTEVVANGRLSIVLNKADAYPDVRSTSRWHDVAATFRATLLKHVPVLRPYIDNIRIYVLSAASIDGRIHHRDAEKIRSASLRSLHQLRDSLRELSRELERSASNTSLYLGGLFDLLGGLDAFAPEVKLNLESLEQRIPAIARLLDDVSNTQADFDVQATNRLEAFRSTLQDELTGELARIDFDLKFSSPPLGEPQLLFRWMLAQARDAAEGVFLRHLPPIIDSLGRFVNKHLHDAYESYVDRQDRATLDELTKISRKTQRIRPLSTTLHHSSRDFVRFAASSHVHAGARRLFNRFSNWYLGSRCTWEPGRGQTESVVKQQIRDNVEAAVQAFMYTWVCEDPSVAGALLPHVCVGGEPTFWQAIHEHIKRLDERLADQVRVTKWKFGMYKSRKFFVSHRDEYQQTINRLLELKERAEELIVQLA